MNPSAHEVMDLANKAGRRGIWPALVLLLVGLIASFLAASFTKSAVDAAARREFEFVCREIRTKIQDRLSAHEQILRSGAAFFADEHGVTRTKWRLYAERQKINQHLPGIQGIGFALRIPREHLAQHLSEVRAEGFPEYQVRPAGERETYTSIIYLEPFADRNLRAFGYDMLSEPVRRAAMERARDQNEAALSGRVVLVQETEKDVQAGTLMYVPVYRTGMPSETVEQRRAALYGWVYSPYRMKDLMQGILGGWDLPVEQRIHLEIFDSNRVAPETLLFDSQSGEDQPKGVASGLAVQNGVVSAGRPWTLRFTRTGGRSSEFDYGKVWLVLLSGTSTSLLLSGLFFSVLNTRFKAWQMASQLTTELRQSEEKYSIIFKNEIYAICIFDLETLRLLDVNDAYTKVYGYSREELLSGLTIHDITAERQSSETSTGKAAREGTIFIPLRYHRRKDGTVFPVEIVGGPYTWQGKRVMFALAHDISVRQQMELALRKSKQQFDGLAANIPVGVYLLRTTPARGFTFEYLSPRMAEMINAAPAAVLADPQVAFQPVHPEDLAGFIQLNRERIESRQPFLWEGRALIKGAVRWLRIESQPEPLENGDILWHGIIVDITERKQAEVEREKLEALNRQLQKSESLGRMASAIAHHFNNQLLAVMLNLELAKGNLPQNAESVEGLADAMQSARKAAEVSTQMLTYLGQAPVSNEPTVLAEVCRQSLPLLRVNLSQNVVLETDLPSPGPVISANANQLQQVLTNLVINAGEACGESGGVIRLTLKTVTAADIPVVRRLPLDYQPQEKAYACLEVADTGCGIAANEIDKLFEPFFSTKFAGRGLGLPVVLGIARSHGAFVTVASEPGQGSTFRVFFPVSADPVPRKADQVRLGQVAENVRRGTTVLVVEDEPVVRQTLALVLKRSGFSVLQAEDGVVAVAMLQQHRDEIGCVVCDLTMPRMNGWDTLTALRQLVPGLPVILASGYSEAQAMAGDHPEQPQAFLHKPYEASALINAINQLMPHRGK